MEDETPSIHTNNETPSQPKLRDLGNAHIDELLHLLVKQKATDLHIAVGLPPVLRLRGRLLQAPYDSFRPEISKRMIYQIITSAQRQKFESTWELEFTYLLGRHSLFQANVFYDRGTVAAAFKLLANGVPSLDELNLPPILEELTHRTKGLILATGPGGSGKTTTMMAMIDTINSTRSEHIVTIEKPIEYRLAHKMSVINQREVGPDVWSFRTALRALRKEDPNVVLIGETYDLDTLQMALTLAGSGHLVFASMRTCSAETTILRCIQSFPDDQQDWVRLQLSQHLQAIIFCQLIPATDGGRIPAQEIMVANPEIRALIREGQIDRIPAVMRRSTSEGMQTMDACLANLASSGKITHDMALARSMNRVEVEKMIALAMDNVARPD